MSDIFHFQVKAEKIARAVSFANKVAQGSGSDNPDHRSVALAGSPKGLIVRTTTHEYQASSIVEADILVNGDCLVYAGTLATFLEAVDPEVMLTFIFDSGLLYITCDKISLDRRIPAIVPEYGIPEWEVKSTQSFVVSLDFAEDIKYAARTACADINKSYYGINVDHSGIVAFNDVQFTKIEKNLPGLPSTTMGPEIVKMLVAPKDFGDGDIEISSDGEKFKIAFGTSSLVGPTVAHNFAATRELIERLIDPYVNTAEPVRIIADYKEFAGALGRIAASAESDVDAVLISPNGSMSIGIDRVNNYQEIINFEHCDLVRPFAVSLKFLKQLFKEAKDEKLVFHFMPNVEFPEEKQIVVIRGDKIIGMSPVIVPAIKAAQKAQEAMEVTKEPESELNFEVESDIW